MSNFGFERLRVVNPYQLAFREARSAVGAAALLRQAEECKSLAEAIADCNLVVGTTAAQNRELRHSLKGLEPAARLIRRALAKERVALLFGSEKRGLSNDDLSYCHWLMRIPASEKHASMNLGQAVAVSLYEIARRSSKRDGDRVEKKAAGADLERLESVLAEALEASGYVQSPIPASRKQEFRRLMRRLKLNPSDAELLLGMLRQISWKLRSG